MVMPNVSIPDFVRHNAGQVSTKRTILWDFSTGEIMAGPEGKVLVYSGPLNNEISYIILKNRIRKLFATVRGESVLYPFSYGSDFHTMIGKPPDYVEARLLSLVSETLSTITLIRRVDIRNLDFDRDMVTFDIVVYDNRNREITVDDIRLAGVLG